LFELDGALIGGAFEAGEEFLAVEGDAGAVFFDDGEADVFFDAFVGGESLAAGEAAAATADGAATFAGARVDDF
jgi:hypothetical protein